MPEREAVDLRWLLAVVRRWLWLIILCTILGLGGAYGVSRYMSPLYSASSTLLIQAAVTDFQAIMTSERLARTYSQLLKERTVLEMVIGQLNLNETPARLARRITASPVPDTQLIRIKVEHTDPNLAAQIANVLTTSFLYQVEMYQTERYSESLTSIKEQIDELVTLMDTTQAKIDILGTPRFPDDQLELARLEGLQAQYRTAFTALLQSYEQMRLSAAQSVQTVTVAESARVPQEPVKTLFLYMTLAGLVGFMVGAGAAFLLEYLDDTVKTAGDVQRALGLKTLGTIGALSRSQRNSLVATELASPHGEAYRVLGTNVCFSDTEVPLRSVLVTSPTAGEGKSLTAANVAAAIAQSGLRVTLVEADLRRPTLGRYFDIDAHSGGLSDALTRGVIDGLLQRTAIEGLSLLDSGEPPSNPTRLLGSQILSDLLDELSRRGDVVVVDGPPVLPVADTMLLARHVDGVLLVLRAGQTRWQAARQAVERLRQVGANVAGVVLNGVSTRGSSHYGSYYYSAYHSANGNGRHRSMRSRASTRALEKGPSRPAQSWGLFSRLFGRRPEGVEEPSSPAAPDEAASPVSRLPSSGNGDAPATPVMSAGSELAERRPAVEPSAQRDLAQMRLVYLFLSAVADPSSGALLNAAWGVCEDGRKVPLHAEPGDRESAEGWDGLLGRLQEHGLAAPLLVISEDQPELIQAIERAFPQSLRQCCLAHKVDDVVSKVPAASRAEIRAAVQAVYYAPDRQTADLLADNLARTYRAAFPAMMASFRDDWEACVAYLRFPRAHHRRIRSVTFLGRALLEERRRSRSGQGYGGPGHAAGSIRATLSQVSQRWLGVPMGRVEIAQLATLRAELGLAVEQVAEPIEPVQPCAGSSTE